MEQILRFSLMIIQIEGNNFLISDRLEQGTYYIEVGSNNSDSTGNYTLYVLTDDHSPTTETGQPSYH